MEPRLVKLIFAFLQSVREDHYEFPYWPLEEIGLEAAAEKQRGNFISREREYPQKDTRKEDFYQDALSIYFNPAQELYSFPNKRKLKTGIALFEDEYEAVRARFSSVLAEIKDHTALHSPYVSRCRYVTRRRILEDLIILVHKLVFLQESAQISDFLKEYGKDIFKGVIRYRYLAEGGPYPQDPQGSLQNIIHDCLCNLVSIVPRDFFLGYLVDAVEPVPNGTYFDQARFREQFVLRLKLRHSLAEAEFRAQTLPFYSILPQ
jgi:hypothetical protein